MLVGLNREGPEGGLISQQQVHGRVTGIDESIRIELESGAEFALPPEPEVFFPAAPGEYRLRSTGEVVVDPDFIAEWTIQVRRG